MRETTVHVSLNVHLRSSEKNTV